MQFFKRIQGGCRLRPTYFLPTAAKSKQKVPLAGNALHPIISEIETFFRSQIQTL
jgi:hypothetical protein